MSNSPSPAISSLYTKYIQKSFAFLFPLLELKSKGRDVILPTNTYLRIKGIYQPQDQKLICSYDRPATDDSWVTYQQRNLLSHRLLDTTVVATLPTLQVERTLYIFDLAYYQQDLAYFLQGQYSQLSPKAKQLICAYYGIDSINWSYLESFLYPDKYFGQYAKLLDIDEHDLRESGELCDRYHEQKETFPGELPDSFVDQLSTI